MSLAFEKLKPVKVPDPRVALKTPKEYLFKQGGNVVTYKELNANSIDNNSANFKCTPPNPNIIVAPLVYIELNVTGSFTFGTFTPAIVDDDGNITTPAAFTARSGISDDDNIFYKVGAGNSLVCPRQFPVSSVIKNLSLKLNTDSTSIPINDYIHALARFYADDEMRAYELSSCPCMPDMYQNYGDGGNYINSVSASLQLGTTRDPMSKFGFNSNEQSRASFLPYAVSYTAGTGVTTGSYNFIEPLFISPLSNGNYNQMGLSQIQTFDVDITFDSNLGRMWSVRGISNASTFNSAFLSPLLANANPSAASGQINSGGGKMHFIYITPQITYQMPDVLIYDYHQFERFTRDVTLNSAVGGLSVATNLWDTNGNLQLGKSRFEVVSDNVQLSCIPNKIYIYARKSNSDRLPEFTDTYYRIEDITIDFNGVSGILSSSKSIDLWRMSVDNGLRMGYDEWSLYSGSVLCIDPSKNMGLGSQQGASMNGTYNFSFRVGLNCLNTVPQTKLTLYTVVDYAGIITLSNQQIVKQIGIVTPKDVLDSEEVKEGDASEIEKITGASMMTGIKSLYSNVRNVAKKAAPYIERALPVVDKAADYLNEHPKLQSAIKTGVKGLATVAPLLLAAGYTHGDIKKMCAQGYKKKDFERLLASHRKGGNMVGGDYRNIIGLPSGGAALSRSNLMRRAANEVNYTMM